MPDALRQKVFGLKMAAGAGAEVSPEMLEKINRFALTPLTAEAVYVRKLLLAHNCIDRDNERFPDEMLDQFAATIVGKSLLVGHNRKETGTGLFFDASTEAMTPEQFTTLTSEKCRLPEGMTGVKVLWTWFYTLKTASSEEWLKWIDGGITRHCSIGFAAAGLNPIRKDPAGPALYWEYTTPGEALEGSLVWLGAQHGATAQKAAKANHQDKGDREMKKLLALLGGILGKSFADDTTEEQAVEAVKGAIAAKETEVRAELKTAVEDGKAFRKALVDDAVKFGALIDEVPTDADAQKKEADFLTGLPIDRLKMIRDKYETRAREKFPTHAVFAGKDQGDREKRGEQGKEKTKTATGKKDFTDPAHNELFGTVGR